MAVEHQQNVIIRLCRLDDAKDYAEIGRLERECAQGTLLKFYFASYDSHSPKLRAQHFKNSLVLVAENTTEGRLVGTISGAVRNACFGEESSTFVKCGSLFSLRISADQRRTGLASRLIIDLERRMRDEYGVKFCFDTVALDNTPASRLFEKRGYTSMWTARYYGINILQAKKKLDNKPLSTNSYSVKCLDKQESRSFLHEHFSKSFLYDAATVRDSNVYVACSGDNSVAINVWADGDRLGIVAVPWMIRLLYYVMIFLSFLFPNFCEKPLPLSRPWMMHFAYPFVVDCNSSRDKNMARDLFNAAISQAVNDLHESGADVLNMPLEKGVSSLNETNYNLVKECPLLSPLMRGTGGLTAIGKCIDETDSADIVATASRQSFWFLNGSL